MKVVGATQTGLPHQGDLNQQKRALGPGCAKNKVQAGQLPWHSRVQGARGPDQPSRLTAEPSKASHKEHRDTGM